MHFQVWHDTKAGNAVALTDTQPCGTLTFVNLAQGQPESVQANLIVPEPTDFIKGRPEVSIIRPTGAGQLDATGAINGFIEDGLFIGQPKELLQFLLNLAAKRMRPDANLERAWGRTVNILNTLDGVSQASFSL